MNQRVNTSNRLSIGDRVNAAVRKYIGPRAVRFQHNRYLDPSRYTQNFLDAHVAEWSHDITGWSHAFQEINLRASEVPMSNMDHNFSASNILTDVGGVIFGLVAGGLTYASTNDTGLSIAAGVGGAAVGFLGGMCLEVAYHYRQVAIRHLPVSLVGLVNSVRANSSDLNHFYVRSVIKDYPEVKALVVEYLSQNMIHETNGNKVHNDRACDFFFMVADLLTEDEILSILQALPEGAQVHIPGHPLDSHFTSQLYNRPELTRIYASNIHRFQKNFGQYYSDQMNVKYERTHEPLSLVLASLQMKASTDSFKYDKMVQSVNQVAENMVTYVLGRDISDERANQFLNEVLQSLKKMGVNTTLITSLKVEMARLLWASTDWTDSLGAEKSEMILRRSLVSDLEEVDPLYRGVLYLRMEKTYEDMLAQYLKLVTEKRSLARDKNLFKRIVTLPMQTLWDIGLNQDESKVYTRQRILRAGLRQLLFLGHPRSFVVAEKTIQNLHQISQESTPGTIKDFVKQTLEHYSQAGLGEAAPAAFELYLLAHVGGSLDDETRNKLAATIESRDDVEVAFKMGLGLFPESSQILYGFNQSKYYDYLSWQAEVMDDVSGARSHFNPSAVMFRDEASKVKVIKESIVMNLVLSGQVKPERMAAYLDYHAMSDSLYENKNFQEQAQNNDKLKALLVSLKPENHLKEMLDLYPRTYSPGAERYYTDPRLVNAMVNRLYEDGQVNQAVLLWVMSFDVNAGARLWFNAIDRLVDQIHSYYAALDTPEVTLQLGEEQHHDLIEALSVLLKRFLDDLHKIKWDKSLVQFETDVMNRVLMLGVYDDSLENQISTYWQKRYNVGAEASAQLREKSLNDLLSILEQDPQLLELIDFSTLEALADRYNRSFGVLERVLEGEE